MNTVAGRATPDDEVNDPPYKALTHDEAQALRARLPMLSPWRVLALQAGIGLLCVLVSWAVTQSAAVAWSALYGVLAVVLPGALLARGMTKKTKSPLAAAMGFLVWEMLKIGVAVALLVIAARTVPHLSWPALLITMVVCLKVNWFALWWRGR